LVIIAGSGPGPASLVAPELVSWISKSEVIAYDRLAGQDILALAPEDAEKLYVGKKPGAPSRSQDEINQLLIHRCLEGKLVVRLKGGDPMVFGRGAEEAEALAEAGCKFRIIPGVTAASAAAASAGIPLTDRRFSSTVALVTGHRAEDESAPPIDWNALARIETVVFYMPVARLRRISDKLIRAGRPAGTPAAVVQNASMPNQKTVVSTLGALADDAESANIKPPALVFVGRVVNIRRRIAWLEKLPLFGQTVAIARPIPSDPNLAESLARQGANVIETPTFRILPTDDLESLDRALSNLAEFDWVAFTSANGVRAALDRLDQLGKDARAFAGVRIAAVGEPTARALAESFLKADLVPRQFTTMALGQELATKYDLTGKRVLLLRSSAATAVLATMLRAAGALADEVHAYSVELVEHMPERLIQAARAGRLDWVALTSPSSVSELLGRIAAAGVDVSSVKLAAIGPVTADAIRAAGHRPIVTACPHTVDALAEAIASYGGATSVG